MKSEAVFQSPQKGPDFKPYSPLAERLIANRISGKKSTVKVDHLAFSFRLAELRHCHKAGFMGKSHKTQTLFPLPPKIENTSGKSIEEIDRHRLKIENILAEFYFQSLKVFVEHILGFDISIARGKGFHGYTDSMTMKTRNGVDIGFIGIGGQNNTVYIQISGQGCKHLFEHTDAFVLHHWLNTVLSVTQLSRLDLCKDDFDGNFDCDYARKAYIDGFFRSSDKGMSPGFGDNNKYSLDKDLNKVFTQEMVTVGSRTSVIYWRVYNKKLEQGIKEDDFIWYRSEAELKKWNVDALLDIDATFAGLCPFAQSMITTQGVVTKSMSKAKDACLELAGRVRWFRRMAGRALGDVLEIFEGDIEKAFGVLLPDDTGQKLGIPPTYQNLINQVLN
ncbi:replication initiation factor domain-containing protein [Thalassomonas sp. RHCl1]|uniref:replication initiation factor domain-containing protein n=1 Tax=Thalassomonas sp. RHCl1 TaxID=2995320 RepID=UPI00248AB4E7|nr:replication initiation factor domain-containing protein [Thalassomonas sp. RHCl1]